LSNGEIIFDVNGGVPSYLFSWSNGDTSASIDGLTSGNYSVVVTDANGCTYEDMITVGFDNTFGIQVFPNPVIITLGESTQLLSAVNPDSPNLSYIWTPSEGLSCSDCPNPIATPTVTTTYTLTVSSTDGCQAETSVTVFVELPCTAVSVPTIFSPNGDGLNDAFCVLGNCIQQIDLSIYNRWGEVVFQSGSLNDCWDGTYRGEPVNSAVFVYKLRAVKDDGEEVLLTGNITVVR
jgi:gliding motility-associated-like protein